MGCIGPSKGLCNTTVKEYYDNGANWCGRGCGYDVCVQPGTDPESFYQYLDNFPAGRLWLDGLSVNDFEIWKQFSGHLINSQIAILLIQRNDIAINLQF